MGHRRKAREIALQVLYQIDVSKIDVDEAIELFRGSFGMPQESVGFSTQLIKYTLDHVKEIDDLIRSCSEHWSLERMSTVDKNILRMAVCEFLYCDDIPPKVTLNEAIDIGKNYGSDNSGSFINGILDAIYAKLWGKDEN
ncbi:MAG: transcription antitermination factor NusB [Deltaproteobacteria bacterium]|nr:transcription antitermination factor NusB [Deltaproteobacteria bacterium]MBW2596506.1 transcription antitermination factor NusB [Deltaproteobacteria bacterium]